MARHSKNVFDKPWPCPRCKTQLQFEHSTVAEVTAYCIKCSYRLVVTNTDLAIKVAKENPALALRMLVDGLQWENICKALGGKKILIPQPGEIPASHRHCKQPRRKSTKNKALEDKVVSLKLKGKTLHEIVKAVKVDYSTVHRIIYVTRRDDLKAARKQYRTYRKRG